MPPSLLKRLSFKNLRKDSKDSATTSSSRGDSSNLTPANEVIPPVPTIPQLYIAPNSTRNSSYLLTNEVYFEVDGSPYSHSKGYSIDAGVLTYQNGSREAIQGHTPLAISIPDRPQVNGQRAVGGQHNGNPSMHDLSELVTEVVETPVVGQPEQLFEYAEGVYAAGQALVPLIQPAAPFVQELMSGLPEMVKVLNHVAQIHPFVAVAVGAFTVVYKMESIRKANDAKITALHAEIKDMISVLIQLKDIAAVDMTQAMKGKLKELSGKTATDIKACANACDTYAKKQLLVRVLMSSVWDDRLATYGGVFTERKKEFELALSIHTATGIDRAGRMLKGMQQATHDIRTETQAIRAEMQAKMDQMLEMFKKTLSAEQKELKSHIIEAGGVEACLNDEEKLKILSVKAHGRDKQVPGSKKATKSGADFDNEVEDLKKELQESPEKAMTKNWERFSGKLEVMATQIKKDMEKTVARATDRIIEEINAGPQNNIIDQDVYHFWNDMGWRGSAKARHFVLALRDHYIDKAGKPQADKVNDATASTLEYFDFPRLRQILEAFDDDFSGFITVSEVNKFTQSRPMDWSLPDWIAWWAVGWQTTMAAYVDEIRNLFRKMFALLPEVLEANRASVDQYLNQVWRPIYTLYESLELRSGDGALRKTLDISPDILPSTPTAVVLPSEHLKAPTSSFDTTMNNLLQPEISPASATASSFAHTDEDVTPAARATLHAKFENFIAQEENELKQHLKSVRYELDEVDTVSLVVGHERIEKTLLPLLYLLLKRHLEIICICRTKVLHRDELAHASEAIQSVTEAVTHRCELLQEVFTQQKLDVKQQFSLFACGIFKYWHDPSPLWTHDRVRDMRYRDRLLDDEKLPACDLKILRYEATDVATLDYSSYEAKNRHRLADGLPWTLLLGTWHMVLYGPGKDGDSVASLASITLTRSDSSKHESKFTGHAIDNLGNQYTVSGKWRAKDEQIRHHHHGSNAIELMFKAKYAVYPTEFYWITVDSAQGLFHGKYGFSSDSSSAVGSCLLTRIVSEAILHFPKPSLMRANRTRALWKYAIDATLDQVRRQLWTWSFLQGRRDVRVRYLDLARRYYHCGRPLDADELEQFERVRSRLTPADCLFYHSIIHRSLQENPAHPNAACDACGGIIGGSRVICLACDGGEDEWNTVDLCDDPRCLGQRIAIQGQSMPHLPTHDIMKIRQTLHVRYFGAAYQEARAALQRAIGLLQDAARPTGAAQHERRAKRTSMRPKNIFRCANLKCQTLISLPCWYCAQCPADSMPFICNTCDEKGTKIKFGHHRHTHVLVRVQTPRSDAQNEETSINTRLETLERNAALHQGAMENRLQSLEERVGEYLVHQRQVDGRLAVIERLLETLVAQMAAPSPFMVE